MQMGYQLRPDLHFCECDTGFIFLDLRQDRYFRLPATLESHFRALVENPLSAGTAAGPLLKAGLLHTATFRQRLVHPRRDAACSSFAGFDKPASSTLEVARALASEMWVSRQLRGGRLAALIRSHTDAKVGRTLSTPFDGDAPARVLGAYELAKLFRSPANRCLSRSLALARRLTNLRCDASLVIGVRAQPFTAHSWVQSDGIVLNDTPDEVSRYTPIFFA